MYQSSPQQVQLEFKPRLYRLWTVLVGLFFGGCSFGIHLGLFSGPLKNRPLVLHFASGFLLVVFVLAMASAPYSKAACILSEEGVALPEPISLDGGYVSADGLEILLFLPVILFCAMFMPAYSKPIEWEAIQSIHIEKGFFGTSLVLDLGGKTRKIGWPLADTKGFQKAVFRYAPFQNSLFQLMRSF